MDTLTNISWLASYPKSGNTWVRMFINAFVTHFPLNINSAYQFAKKDIDPGVLQLLCPTNIKDLTNSEQFVYRAPMLLNMLKLTPQKRLCLKTHSAKIAVNDFAAIPLCLSDVAIYIIRDPRDVAISLSYHLGYPIDETIEFMNNGKQGIKDKTTNIVEILLTWSQHVESWTIKNNNLSCLTIRYEDLLLDAESTFKMLIEFLRLDTIPDYEERIQFALAETDFSKLQEYEKEKDFVEKGESEKFFRVGKAGQWREILTVSQIGKIVEDHGAMMEEFSYD